MTAVEIVVRGAEIASVLGSVGALTILVPFAARAPDEQRWMTRWTCAGIIAFIGLYSLAVASIPVEHRQASWLYAVAKCGMGAVLCALYWRLRR